MNNLVTLSELKKKYPDEWVLIGDPRETGNDINGVLILHHKSKKELANQFSKYQHQFNNTILRYTGNKPAIGKWLRFIPSN
jgi:hypothetical protein